MKPTPEDRRRAVYAALEPHLLELASILRMYPKRSMDAMNVAQAGEQLCRAMSWTMEGVRPASSTTEKSEQ